MIEASVGLRLRLGWYNDWARVRVRVRARVRARVRVRVTARVRPNFSSGWV